MKTTAFAALLVWALSAAACGESTAERKDAGQPDSRGAAIAADSAVADGSAASPDAAALRDATNLADAPLAAYDAQPADAAKDAAPALPDAAPDRPRVNPYPGHYSARPCEPVLDGGTDQIFPLSAFGFTVIKDAAGGFSIRYAADNWAFQSIAVTDGSFFGQKGQGFDGRGGTYCPTDAFQIDGYFTSPMSATGKYASGYSCRVANEGCFVAALDNPPAEPAPEAIDGGMALDSSAN